MKNWKGFKYHKIHEKFLKGNISISEINEVYEVYEV